MSTGAEAGDGPPEVRAAGGVVWRPRAVGGPSGPSSPAGPASVEVLIVHRPHRRDWSFPKGKNDPGESDEHCALREVAEETGLRCRLGADLGTVSYTDAKGRPKTVHWWAMTVEVEGRGPETADEVDELRWLPLGEVAAQLSYDSDRLVLGRFLPTVAAVAG